MERVCELNLGVKLLVQVRLPRRSENNRFPNKPHLGAMITSLATH